MFSNCGLGHSRNDRYLQFQKQYSDACLPWFLLFWRDIFRICMIATTLYETASSAYETRMLMPHLICVSLYILCKIWESIKRDLDESNKYENDRKQWCLSIIWYILTSLSGLFIFPCAGFYTLHWCEDDMHRLEVGRLFSVCFDAKIYTTSLLKYILNNNHQQIKRKIVATNYYLTTKFMKKTNSIDNIKRCTDQINYFSHIHNSQKNGLCDITWTDIQAAGGYDSYTTISRWFRSVLLLGIVIYNVILLTILQKRRGATFETRLFCFVSIIMDIFCLPFDFKYFQLYWYCYHILPFMDLSFPANNFWDSEFENVDDMMQNLNIMSQIMFSSMEKTVLIENEWHNIPPEIVHLIGEFLWTDLPICQDKQINQFKNTFNKLILSFKNANDCKLSILIENKSKNQFIVTNHQTTDYLLTAISI